MRRANRSVGGGRESASEACLRLPLANVTNWRASGVLLLAGLMSAPAGLAADQQTVRIPFRDIELTADLVQEDGGQRPMFLIVHGTLTHKDMALIETLQTAFDEAGQDSLAITLSLGISDRMGPYPCDVPHRHTQEDAIEEINVWAAWLRTAGYTRFSLVGHSRGAAHAVEFASQYPHQLDHVSLIAPPRSFKARHDSQHGDLQSNEAWIRDIEFLHCEKATVSERSFESYYSTTVADDLINLLEKTRTPILVVSGTEDTVSGDLADVAASVNNNRVSFSEVAGADHFFQDLYAYDAVDYIVSAAESLPRIKPVQSLSELSAKARDNHEPIVLFFSEPDCSYCHALRTQVLLPMIAAGELQDGVLFREVSIDSGFELRDFSGSEADGASFAKKFGVFAAPTIVFLDADGNPLVKPIVGVSNLEMYEHYLLNSLQQAAH